MTTGGHGVAFSRESGVVGGDRVVVTMTAPAGHTVAWTTDGRVPCATDDTGLGEVTVELDAETPGYLISHRGLMVPPEDKRFHLFDDPSLPRALVVRAAAVGPDGVLGPMETRTFFMGSSCPRFFDCTVVSVVTDPANLLDYETGILAWGATRDAWAATDEGQEIMANKRYWEWQGNFTRHGAAWERPCTVQLFDGGGSLMEELPAGMRVTGGASRNDNQKSFNLYFRRRYGVRYLECDLFGIPGRYRNLRLRNGGNNTEGLKFKDALLQWLVRERCFDTVEACLSMLFLNGEYWGPYLLSEKPDRHKLHDLHGVRRSQVVLFKEGILDEGRPGDERLYDELMAFAGRDLSRGDAWDEFCRVMDVRSFADYAAVRIYLGDADWKPDTNDLLWRTRDASFNGGRWRYILYDVEFSSGLYGGGETAPTTDHLAWALECYPLFAAAMENPTFYGLFLGAIRELATRDLEPEWACATLWSYAGAWQPLMDDYYRRFGDVSYFWRKELKSTEGFFRRRPGVIVPIVEAFGRARGWPIDGPCSPAS